MEIKGELSVTFKVKDAVDMERIMTFCRQFEGQPAVKDARHARHPGRRPTKAESQERIVSLLKERFPQEGFTMRDATDTVLNKLDLRETTTKHAITRAKKDGILLRRGRVYVWTEVIQQRVAARQAEQPQELKEIRTSTTPIMELPELP